MMSSFSNPFADSGSAPRPMPPDTPPVPPVAQMRTPAPHQLAGVSSTTAPRLRFSGNDMVEQIVEETRARLRRSYPDGGFKASKIITYPALAAAPRGYFDRFSSDVADGVYYVRSTAGESSRVTGLLQKAKDNPTDYSFQDDAYLAIYQMTSDFLSRKMWQGTQHDIVAALIQDEVLGFGPLDPLWRDRQITEILCNGPFDVQVEIKGELSKVESCHFRDRTQLEGLISQLFRAIGKQLSQTTPLVKGRLSDMSRIYATDKSVSPAGPNLSIRRHPAGFWEPQDLVKYHSASAELMTTIGNIIYKGGSALLIGGTHSGKTSLLNAVTGFYKPNVRILTLEDNLEMKPNPKKFLAAALECRDSGVGRNSDTDIKMRDLVKASLQLRPDVVVVGEVTDGAAYDLCQALNTGHAGASTLHANTSQDAMIRLSSLVSQDGLVSPAGALDFIAAAFDIVVCLRHFPMDGSRRIVSVDEVGTHPTDSTYGRTLKTRPLWRFVSDGIDENKKLTGHWDHVSDLSEDRIQTKALDIEDDLTWDQLQELSSIPDNLRVQV